MGLEPSNGHWQRASTQSYQPPGTPGLSRGHEHLGGLLVRHANDLAHDEFAVLAQERRTGMAAQPA